MVYFFYTITWNIIFILFLQYDTNHARNIFGYILVTYIIMFKLLPTRGHILTQNYLFKMSHKLIPWSLAHLMLNILHIVVTRRVKYEYGALSGGYLRGKTRISRKKTWANGTISIRIYTRTDLGRNILKLN